MEEGNELIAIIWGPPGTPIHFVLAKGPKTMWAVAFRVPARLGHAKDPGKKY